MFASRYVFGLLFALALATSAVPASAQGTESTNSPLIGPDGTHGISPPDRLLITSTRRLDLDTGLATVPIFRGTANAMTVWFVITDV